MNNLILPNKYKEILKISNEKVRIMGEYYIKGREYIKLKKLKELKKIYKEYRKEMDKLYLLSVKIEMED